MGGEGTSAPDASGCDLIGMTILRQFLNTTCPQKTHIELSKDDMLNVVLPPPSGLDPMPHWTSGRYRFTVNEKRASEWECLQPRPF